MLDPSASIAQSDSCMAVVVVAAVFGPLVVATRSPNFDSVVREPSVVDIGTTCAGSGRSVPWAKERSHVPWVEERLPWP